MVLVCGQHRILVVLRPETRADLRRRSHEATHDRGVPQVPLGRGVRGDQPAPRCIVDEAERGQWRFGGFALELFRDEAENYFANITAPIPKVFVMWRMDGERARPAAVSVSYGEAARWLDSGEQVDGVAMPREIADWVGDFVNTHYKPEPKKKVKRNDPLGLDRRRT